jgi:hypothetical protein
MKILFEQSESEKIFYDALCNAVGTGYMKNYGIELTCDRSQYKDCKEHLLRVDAAGAGYSAISTICYEDILMQVLRDGGELTFEDIEGEGDMTSSITMKDVHERVQTTDPKVLLRILSEQDDASDADQVLQTVFFKEVIFG